MLLVAMGMQAIALNVEAQQLNQSYDAIFGGDNNSSIAVRRNSSTNRIDSHDGRAVADNLIHFQNPDGGWTRDIDWLAKESADSVMKVLEPELLRSTLLNRSTYAHVEYLSLAYTELGDERYKESALKGLDYILNTQKSNGGWGGWEIDQICFNNGLLPNVLKLLYNVATKTKPYEWIDKSVQKKAQKAYDLGLQLMLKCQYVRDGKLTAWGCYHDNETFAPCEGRKHEQPALSSRETAFAAMMLMGIKNPSTAVKNAVNAAISWLESQEIRGIRLESVPLDEETAAKLNRKNDRVVVADEGASRIWARCYELADDKIFFCNNDGQKVYDLKDVEIERRASYAWYGYWPEVALRMYSVWAIYANK